MNLLWCLVYTSFLPVSPLNEMPSYPFEMSTLLLGSESLGLVFGVQHPLSQ